MVVFEVAQEEKYGSDGLFKVMQIMAVELWVTLMRSV